MKPTFKEILAQRQEYLDALRSRGDMYALGFLESSFLYHMGDNGLEPLNPSQLSTLSKWKEESVTDMININKIGADDLINQIADALCEVNVDFLCGVANKVLTAHHTAAGKDAAGYDLIQQKDTQ